jgi:hypothetical protein
MNAQGQKLKIIITLLLLAVCSYTLHSQATTKIIRGNKITVKSKGKHSHNGVLTGYDVEYEGDVEISDDDTDVLSVSRGGYLEISKTTFGSKRKIYIENGSSGKLEKEYYEGRKQIPFEPQGRKWLAEVLPEMVRSTGLGAKSRVDRFYKKGGVSSVLEEVGRLDGSYVKSKYAKILLDKDELSADELSSILNRISDEVSSDFYLADIMKNSSDRFLMSDVSAEAYLNAIDEISSDYYSASVLKEAINNKNVAERHNSTLIRATRNISSDYYMSSTLTEIMKEKELTDELLSDLIMASKEISSDYYQSQLLSETLEQEGLSSTGFNQLLEAISEVSSDHYMTTVFSKILDKQVNEAVLIKIIDVVGNDLSSDYYASSVLSKVFEEQVITDNVMNAFMISLDEISSDHYATEVIRKAADNDNMGEKEMIKLIEAISRIDSDHYLSSSLAEIAPKVSTGSEALKSAYRRAAKEISSDTYYGRAMKAID